MKKIKIFFLLLWLCSFGLVNGQDRFQEIESKLRLVSVDVKGLNATVEISVNDVSIQEFIRGLASANGINVSVDPSLNFRIINNFSNVSVMDVYLFLCKNYDLDIAFTGNILMFKKYAPPPAPEAPYEPKAIKINYDAAGDKLSFDLNKDSLSLFAKELTKITGKNIVFSPELVGKTINGFIQDAPFLTAMEQIAFANDLQITQTDENFFLIEKRKAEETAAKAGKKGEKNGAKGQPVIPEDVSLTVDANGLITLYASNSSIADLVAMVSLQLKKNYYLFSEIKGNTTLNITNSSYDEFLTYVLNGTDFTYKKLEGLYLIGDRNIEGLRATKVVEMKYRTVEKIVDFIPGDLKKNVDVKVFPDLNSLILSGSQPRIDEIEKFLRDIDRIVPVVLIEVLIVDVRNTRTLSTGIEAGLSKDKPVVTGGVIYPGVDMTLSSSSINNIISGINGLGVVNLGKVTPNFYINLKALEEQGILKLRSTPKLATLNGHEAKMSIGNTEYYLEISNNVIGTQNPQNIITQQYKSVNADLSITINPMVSSDEQITLDIGVKQSDFTERISPSAPPGTITRDFKSLIRVKNEEMIILGGLEENSKNDTGSGVPFLARIPILKWLFSSRTNTKSDNRLTIFIKPTVLY